MNPPRFGPDPGEGCGHRHFKPIRVFPFPFAGPKSPRHYHAVPLLEGWTGASWQPWQGVDSDELTHSHDRPTTASIALTLPSGNICLETAPMRDGTRSTPPSAAGLMYWLLAIFLLVLWVAGGASRADAAGQFVVRLFACGSLIILVLFGPRIDWLRVKPLAILLGASVALTALHLLPLPPALWTGLPGRAILEQAAAVTGQPQPWRPLSISPSSTANALGSLIIPATALALAANLSRGQHWRILALLLALVVAGCLLGLLQFSGARFDNPFINDLRGAVSANFANRNHFALFVAIGCVLAPVWGFRAERGPRWKGIATVGLLALFVLIALATGSRAGTVLCGIGIVAGFWIVRDHALRELRALPRAAAIALVVTAVGIFALAIGLSITLDRAASVTRAVDLEAGEDLRRQALPYVIQALGHYFPWGSGFGTFDPVYRMVEPDELLSPRYFNHAHNDWLEVVLDGGIASAAILAAALVWWLAASRRAWFGADAERILPKVGSTVIFLILLASAVDYPARTPMVMAVLILAGIWLNGDRSSRTQRTGA